MKVYLAGPLFSEAEREFNQRLKALLDREGYSVFLPQEDSNEKTPPHHHRQKEKIFRENLRAIEECDLVVAVLDGSDADSGTAWEIGYASAIGKPVIGLKTDFRTLGPEGRVNLMIEQSITRLCTTTDELVNGVQELKTLGSGESWI
ncbi:nucleoside 2-deoxyribosyltransferase [Methanosarcinales archaeon ex4572_44]|nr:MAG: nucleoside 2-deoxyribosyltransferase [Methanosarcinales archaeon ex4572_44]RLG26964.1 MAG: nucleoside 2-deoxyribosyltransferase [Methanosarcinales archaeon]